MVEDQVFVSLFETHQAQRSLERESHEMRFKRLQHLLQKSNIYSKFLLTKMEQQQNEVSVCLSPAVVVLAKSIFFNEWCSESLVPKNCTLICLSPCQEKIKKEKLEKKAKKVRKYFSDDECFIKKAFSQA